MSSDLDIMGLYLLKRESPRRLEAFIASISRDAGRFGLDCLQISQRFLCVARHGGLREGALARGLLRRLGLGRAPRLGAAAAREHLLEIVAGIARRIGGDLLRR